MRLVSLFIIIVVVIIITLAEMLTGGVTDLFGYAAGVQWLSHSPQVTHTHTETHLGNLAQFDTLNILRNGSSLARPEGSDVHLAPALVH